MSTSILIHQPVSETIIRHTLDNSLGAIEHLYKQLNDKGYAFLRNQNVDNYTFDFYCPTAKIAIEVDGYAHEFSDVYSKDVSKKLFISSLGITVLRFTDYQILVDMDEIFRTLKNQFIQN